MNAQLTRVGSLVAVIVVVIGLAVLLSFAKTRMGDAPGIGRARAGALEQSYAAFDAGNPDGALAAAENALAAYPANIAALLAKAAALSEKGSLTYQEEAYGVQAIAVAQEVLRLDPASAEAWRQIGYANEIMQRYDEAHDAYAKALELAPNNALAAAGDAHAWDLQGDMQKAEAGYRQALAMNPNLVLARIGLARALLYGNKPEEALQLYGAVAGSEGATVRQRAEAAYSAGAIQEGRGQYEDAEAAFRYAAGTDPTYPLGWVGLSQVAFRKGVDKNAPLSKDERIAYMQEALGSAQQAISLNPNQSAAHYQLGLELAVLGQRDDAKMVLRQTIEGIIPRDISLSAAGKEAMKQKVNNSLADLDTLQVLE